MPDDQDEIEVPLPIPNFAVKRKTSIHNGETEQWLEVRYGEDSSSPTLPQHVIEIRKIDMGDQFDLAEIAGPAVDNNVWLSLAVVAMAVQTIDGTPQPRGIISKGSLRRTLKAIGTMGVRAIRRATDQFDSDDPSPDQDQANRVKVAAGN
jgi:hypothetical protein